jgi:hypothetical protein
MNGMSVRQDWFTVDFKLRNKDTSTAPLDQKGSVLLLFFTKYDGETPSPLPAALASVTMVAEIKEQKSSLSTQNWKRCARSYKKVQK